MRECLITALRDVVGFIEFERADAPVTFGGKPVRDALWFDHARKVLGKIEAMTASELGDSLQCSDQVCMFLGGVDVVVRKASDV